MELRRYFGIIKRYLWLIALILLVTLVGSIITHKPSPVRYGATMRFVVGVVPESNPGQYYGYDRYYTWLASEYLVDDLAEVVRGRSFAQRVAEKLQASGTNIPPEALYGAIGADTKHRTLSVHISWHNPVQIAAIAQAVTEALQDSGDFFPQLGHQKARVELIDPAIPYPLGRSLREKLDIPLRLILALIAGVALAFLLDYLDETVRSREDLEEMGLEVLAEIPRKRKWPWMR
ncbi:MAG: hypothetical protein DRI61_12345 [Chloroflexi bacterium]|nr:MAG: hypothetical protein DRI61_12345 [Chloroflexota bacterium]HDN79404.1 hypothetical protein [Chloroflexota bacterium]